MVAHVVISHSTWELKAGKSEVPSHPWLYSKFKASLGYAMGDPISKATKQKE